MTRFRTLKAMFRRYRRPGDIVFAWVFLAFSLILLSQIAAETTWKANGKLFAQPRFWPAVSLIGMSLFAALHLIGSALSERLHGRWQEVWTWVRSLEFAGWFVLYAIVVPFAGYLPSTVILAVLLLIRCGYGSLRTLGWGALTALAIVVLFKAFLQVKLPGGAAYEYLPDGIRQFMLTYF
ncbi:tripartite tricarboxylate transporter TctB family protein [Antarctobacter jejuensis]|uniref:tripartite tricarboxylate transporter TctB family protein n=1 Tax=Antarctobacter jejuensis TaxID=1439938 RepID=UPI003FD4ACC7